MLSGDRKSRRRWAKVVALVFVLAGLALVISTPFRRTVEFHIGDKTISIRVERLLPNGPFSGDGVFSRTIWDGPTGSFSSGEVIALKLGSRLLRLDLVDDPITAAQARLPETLPGLIKAVSSNDRWLRFCALEELARMGASAQAALPALVRACEKDSEAPDTLLQVSKASGAEAVPVLTNALKNPKPAVREKVAEILGEMGPAATTAIPSLVSLLSDAEPRVRLQSAYALWKVDGKTHGAVPVLMALLANPDSEMRGGSAFVLGEFGSHAADAVPVLAKALQDTNAQVRGMCARALGMIGSAARSTIPLLVNQLDDGDDIVLMFTTAALRQFGEDAREAVPKLTELAMGGGSSGRLSTEALATMGSDAAPALARIYRDARGNRYSAAKSLIELGPKGSAALPVLLEALNSDRAGWVALAAQVVGHLGDDAKIAVPRLTELLASDDQRVRVRVAGALWRLDRQTNTVLAVLLGALRDNSFEGSGARRMAAEELAGMGPTAAEAVPPARAHGVRQTLESSPGCH
jgi:HEAT repeat protein